MTIQINHLGRAVLDAQYAVRGPIVDRAKELERSGREIIFCNIGNPQALKQKPLTYLRQVLSLCEFPELLSNGGEKLFPSDIVQTAKMVIAETRHGIGAYSDSKGYLFARKAIAQFINTRDGISADPESIYLTDGASKGVQTALRLLIAGETDGIMTPIPQYPLYSATITLYGGRQVGYFLDESNNWHVSQAMLEDSFAKATQAGTRVRAIVVINPGNPTGSVLNEQNVRMIVEFARKHQISVLADEVYQENLYENGQTFISFAKVVAKLNIKDVSLFSFHSCSKGYLGECGVRGGYFEIRNVPQDVADQITKLQSINLCSNTIGQIATYLMVRPPREGEESYCLFKTERDSILGTLREKAKLLAQGLNQIPGIQCNVVEGAMYAFPKISLPPGRTDEDYCLELLEKTGICLVPGTGFGQLPGTQHFRITILPPKAKVAEVVQKISEFQKSFR